MKPARDSIQEALLAVHKLHEFQGLEQSVDWLEWYNDHASQTPAFGEWTPKTDPCFIATHLRPPHNTIEGWRLGHISYVAVVHSINTKMATPLAHTVNNEGQ